MAFYKMLFTIFMMFSLSLCWLLPTTTKALPFVVFHGTADNCNNGRVANCIESLSNWSGAQGPCVNWNGARDSWFMPFLKQTEIASEKVKKMSELSEGYSIVGLSQGNLVGRGVIEFCDDAPPDIDGYLKGCKFLPQLNNELEGHRNATYKK